MSNMCHTDLEEAHGDLECFHNGEGINTHTGIEPPYHTDIIQIWYNIYLAKPNGIGS